MKKKLPAPPAMRSSGRRDPQRGAALLLAMMIVALVSTLSIAMVWQQWRAVQVEAAERARAQSYWILAGALDWARLILREDARGSNGNVDHLGEPWAVPLAEARLSTFLAADKNNSRAGEEEDSGPDAFLSGSITDAQSRFNLNNLSNRGKIDAAQVNMLKRLFESISVSPELVSTIAQGLQINPPRATPITLGVPTLTDTGELSTGAATGLTSSSTTVPNPNPNVRIQSLAQLAWLGLDVETIQRIEPYVTILPARTLVNLNTASREVLAAVLGVDLGTAERLTQTRLRTPFKSVADAERMLPAGTDTANKVSVQSNYFEIRGRLRLEDKALEERSLVKRQGFEVTPLFRERINVATPH